MPIRGLPANLVGARLIQVSDLHIGPQVDSDYLLRVLRTVRELEPAIVVYTGDFVTAESSIDNIARWVFDKLVQGSLGTFGILGNHDYGRGWESFDVAEEVVSLSAKAGVTILRNQVANVGGLSVLGFDDLWAEQFSLSEGLAQLQLNEPCVAMVHNPDAVDEPGWGNFRGWILSGHTHGGQCKPPFLDPPLLPVRNRRYTSGEFELSGERRLYISRGVGHLIRVRFNARPEITVFELERESDNGERSV